MAAVAETGAVHGARDRATALAILALMGCELLWLASGWTPFRLAAFGSMLAVVPLAAHRLGMREAYLLTLCTALTVLAAAIHPQPLAVVYAGLEQAAFLMAFVLLIGLVQQAAMTSEAILECGLFLTRQRADRRYFALFGGTHTMAHLFNLGTVSLLAPLIKRGTEGADALNPIRERRQLNSMLRGFAWSVVWSPTAVAPLVLATLLPDARRGPWMLAGFAIAMAVMVVGFYEDKWQWRAYRPAPGTARPAFPARAYGHFALVCGAMVALTAGAMVAFDGSVVFGLMVASPIILIGWLLIQKGGDAGAVGARLREIGAEHLPGAAPVAVTLACSGYVGRAAAALIPAADWAAALGIGAWPGWLFMLSLSVGIAVLSQLALSPIMMAVFFGSLIAALPVIPVDATWAALAISCGWGLSMTASPFATVILMVGQATGHTGRELAWEWNWRFSLLCVAVLGVAYRLLTG